MKYSNQKLLYYSPIWPIDDDDDNTAPAVVSPTDRPPFDVLLALALNDINEEGSSDV